MNEACASCAIDDHVKVLVRRSKVASCGLQNVARGISSSLCKIGITGFRVIDDSTNIAFVVNPFQVCFFLATTLHSKRELKGVEILLS